MTRSLKKSQTSLCGLLILCGALLFSPKLHAQAIFEVLPQFGGWPVFECANVDHQPPPQLVCYTSTGLFGTQRVCNSVDQPITRQIRCDWRKENLYFGDRIAVLDECCAAASDTIDIYLEIADPISNWKALRVSGHTADLEGTGRGGQNIPPNSSWHRFGPITVKMADLPGPILTLSHKNWLGHMDDLYLVDLTAFAHYRGRKVIFQWLWDNGAPTQFPDPIFATALGVPLDGTILREDHSDARVVAGGAQFRLDDATLSRMYPSAVQYFANDGTLDAALRSAPVDGTLLRDENGAVWVTIGRSKLQIPDPQTQMRLYGAQAPVQLWNGALDQLLGRPDNGTLLHEENGALWVIAGGAKFQITDPGIYNRFYKPLPAFSVWNGALSQMPARPSDGSSIRYEDGTIWIIFGGAKFHVPDPATFAQLYPDEVPTQLWTGAIDAVPATPVNGTVFRDENTRLWVIDGGAKFELPDNFTHDLLYPTAYMWPLWNAALQAIPNIPVDDTLMREQNGAIWVIDGKARFHVPDPATFNAFFPNAAPFNVWDGAVNSIPTIPANGTYFREKSSSIVFRISGGKRYPATTVPASAKVYILWDGALAQIPWGRYQVNLPPRP